MTRDHTEEVLVDVCPPLSLRTHIHQYEDTCLYISYDTFDGKTDLLTGLLGGKQGWKCPVSLLVTCCGSKLLKVILIVSDFGYYPLLNPLVTL